ncbi:hypothetical protein EVAR_71505_1 [Eumeta japonica]|uniref:Uncharacterized protein n=1 Tax=Eumeta variegata TaxID=151549 RepID=A0A4C1SN17_EUMVA|nr:hypothetical protein EVAR_71505_1 [Eumeta japonica]
MQESLPGYPQRFQYFPNCPGHAAALQCLPSPRFLSLKDAAAVREMMRVTAQVQFKLLLIIAVAAAQPAASYTPQ